MIVALLTCVVLAATVASCVSDVKSLRIPNAYVVAILLAFVPAFLIAPEQFGAWWEHLGAFAAIFAITYVMFAVGMIGGGDAKLGSALALWVGLKGLMAYVFYMAVVGGVLGLFSLLLKKKKPFTKPKKGSWVATVQDGGNAVPYGIALSIGAWAGLFHTGFLGHQLDELIRIIH